MIPKVIVNISYLPTIFIVFSVTISKALAQSVGFPNNFYPLFYTAKHGEDPTEDIVTEWEATLVATLGSGAEEEDDEEEENDKV